jgi:hypothetical protein
MKKRRGNLPMCIVRPAIINTSYLEPFPGWLDSIAAAAAMFLFVGLGIVREVSGDKNKIGDMIPVDIVVANIIVASAKNFNRDALPIYHVGSSDRNPIPWRNVQKTVTEFWNNNPSSSRMGKSEVLYTENQTLLKLS